MNIDEEKHLCTRKVMIDYLSSIVIISVVIILVPAFIGGLSCYFCMRGVISAENTVGDMQSANSYANVLTKTRGNNATLPANNTMDNDRITSTINH